MGIKKIVGEVANKFARKEEFTYSPKNYMMREIYDAEKLVVGKLEYISSDATEFDGPMVIKTSQNYIFEPMIINGVVKYQEVFTGFVAGAEAVYFDLPSVTDIEKFTEILPNYKELKIPRLGMLLALNEVTSKMVEKNDTIVKFKSKKQNK